MITSAFNVGSFRKVMSMLNELLTFRLQKGEADKFRSVFNRLIFIELPLLINRSSPDFTLSIKQI